MGTTKSEIDKQTKYAIQQFIRDVLPLIKPGGRILDVGIGPMARYAIEFAKAGYKVTGLDISKTTLKYAKKYIQNQGAYPIKLAKGDMILR